MKFSALQKSEQLHIDNTNAKSSKIFYRCYKSILLFQLAFPGLTSLRPILKIRLGNGFTMFIYFFTDLKLKIRGNL
ncbi:hypothetical protein ACEE_10125 [Actinobacillus equuli subsp. equuli]|nr:hypothetical protein ACEE_10125 [Actinobacillus equuli subsp. equuli]